MKVKVFRHNFGIKTLRQNLGISEEKLAHEAGVSLPSLWLAENDYASAETEAAVFSALSKIDAEGRQNKIVLDK